MKVWHRGTERGKICQIVIKGGQFVKTNYGRVGGQNLSLGSIVQILLIINQFKYIENFTYYKPI